jgi:hypothetical protein
LIIEYCAPEAGEPFRKVRAVWPGTPRNGSSRPKGPSAHFRRIDTGEPAFDIVPTRNAFRLMGYLKGAGCSEQVKGG